MRRYQKEPSAPPRAEMTDEEVKEFERELEGYESQHLTNELRFYGEPLNEEKFPGVVMNEILGGVHWSVVAYALEKGAIGKGPKGWFVNAEILEKRQGGRCETKVYNYFMFKYKALQNLRERRRFAKKKESESLENLV